MHPQNHREQADKSSTHREQASKAASPQGRESNPQTKSEPSARKETGPAGKPQFDDRPAPAREPDPRRGQPQQPGSERTSSTDTPDYGDTEKGDPRRSFIEAKGEGGSKPSSERKGESAQRSGMKDKSGDRTAHTSSRKN